VEAVTESCMLLLYPTIMERIFFTPKGFYLIAQGCPRSGLPWDERQFFQYPEGGSINFVDELDATPSG
jgi:hypothetical protein